MERFSPGLRTRLLSLVLLAVVPAFVAILYTTVSDRQYIAAQVEKDATKLVRLASHDYGDLITHTRQLLLNLSQLPVIQARVATPACHQVLAEAQRSYRHYTHIALATLDGNIVCSSRRLRRQINVADRTYFQRTLRIREFAAGDYETNRLTGEPAINFAFPVFDTEGDVRGVIFTSLSLRWLEHLITEVEPPSGSVIFVTDANGTILAHHPNSDDWVGESVKDEGVLARIKAGESGGIVELDGLDGVSRLYAFSLAHLDQHSRAYAVVGIPRAIAFAEADRQFLRNLLLLLVAALLAGAAAWVGSDAFVLRRVKTLTEAAQRLGTGDFSARTGLPHGSEELGQLAHRFDDMAGTLQRVNRALKTLSAGNRALVRATDEHALLTEMCRIVVEVGRYRMAWVGYAEQDEQKTIRPITQWGFDGGLPALTRMVAGITWDDTALGRGALGTAIRTGKQAVMRDFQTNPNLAPWREEAARCDLGSCVAFPLHVYGNPIGALAIYAPEPDAFKEDEMELLEESAGDLAFGIEVLRARREGEQAHATIQHMAYFDQLTGLPNHAQFEEHMRLALPDARSHGDSLALMMFGVNHLHDINDAFGFHFGDLLLKNVGARIAEVARGSVCAARMRGDNFAVLLPFIDDDHAARTVSAILDSLRKPFILDDLELDVNVAAGVSLFPRHATDATQLMRCADIAMQQARKAGENFTFYVPGQDAATARRLGLASDLHRAIESGELVLYYQPKLELPTLRLCGAEALVRWIHPKRGMIRPDEFIELAEHTGLIKPLTDWVIGEALRQSRIWRDSGFTLPVAVNLSARSLDDAALLDKINRLFDAHGAQSHWLELEITEGDLIKDPDGAREVFRRLNGMGIALFIDDFGTGYSSLDYLQQFPVQAIKIDKSFVRDMLTKLNSAAIVRSTIALAHDLGLKVVAEGVENEEMLDKLVMFSCDAAQGYHFAKPLPAAQFRDWATARRHFKEPQKIVGS